MIFFLFLSTHGLLLVDRWTLEKYRVAIIGLGVVGKAQVRLFDSMVHATYDPLITEGPYPSNAVRECDFAVITVGTPSTHGGAANLSYLDEALSRIPPEIPVLIRSTIPPGTMIELEEYRSLVGHMPEFLNEREDGQWRNSADVPFVILGGTSKAHKFFTPILKEIFDKRDIYLCSGLEAEIIKYTCNCYLASKVTFVNEMARICEALGADWELIRQGWLKDPRVGSSHTIVEGPGFSGRCLPKDLSAIIKVSEDAGYLPEFLWAIEDSNGRFKETT